MIFYFPNRPPQPVRQLAAHFRHCPTVGHTGGSIDGKHGFVDDCIRANHETRTVDSDRSRSGCRLPWFELTCESH